MRTAADNPIRPHAREWQPLRATESPEYARHAPCAVPCAKVCARQWLSSVHFAQTNGNGSGNARARGYDGRQRQ